MRNHLLTLFALLALLGASCNRSGDFYPVTGTVLVNGQPAVGATVTFVRRDVPEGVREHIQQGVVEEDGTFALVGPAGKGAQPGEYIVLVEWKEGAGTNRGRAPALSAPDRLQKRYLDPTKPLLTAVVEAKTNVLPTFELK